MTVDAPTASGDTPPEAIGLGVDAAVAFPDVDSVGSVGEDSAVDAPARRPRRWLSMAGVALVAGLALCWAFVAEPVRVRSSSMAPTLEDGDRIIVNKLAYRSDEPRVGEVVVFDSPNGTGLVVKRVVAVEGDEVGIEDGVLVVNRVARVESYVDQETIDGVYFGPVEVPDGSIFVMGDNRAESVDSREYGPVPIDDVVGRVSWRVWPLG